MTVIAGESGCLLGAAPSRVAVFACATSCEPIPWQVDRRDDADEYILDRGPQATRAGDDAIDDNDELVLMWSDLAAGRAVVGDLVPRPICVDEIEVSVGTERRRAYVVVVDDRAPRSPIRYVDYDVDSDRMRGAVVELTFAGPTPRGLTLERGAAAGRNLLDRLKIRAKARFFGIFPLRRDEDDIQSVYEAWRVGPIRVIRRERKWVELAFGYRTPYMRTETTFYRDFALLPVRMRLNFAPASLLSGIELLATLDFIDLSGWRIAVPGYRGNSPTGDGRLEVGAVPQSSLRALGASHAPLIALEGDDATLVLALRLGPSLDSLSKTILYAEGPAADAPEEVPGSLPAIGFRLADWGQIDAGQHWFVAECYALPAGTRADEFFAQQRLVPEVSIRRCRDLAEAIGTDPHLTTPAAIH